MAEKFPKGTGHARQISAGQYVKHAYALEPKVTTAIVTDVYLDGDAVDRTSPDIALSAIPAIPAKIVMASGHTLVVTRRVQERKDSTDTWADLGLQPANLSFTANNDGSAITTDLGKGWNIDLSECKEQVRIRFLPDFSASGVDTIAAGGSLILSGLGYAPGE